MLALVMAGLYLNRRAAARQVMTRWLASRGVSADVTVDRLELDRFVGRIRIGDPASPDFSVETVEVDYALAGPWATGGLGVMPTRIRLLRPVVRATWTGGRLSFGSLDPLIKTFAGQPPRPDSRSPVVIIEQGRLGLTTEYGAVQVLADAALDDGKLMRLHAVLPAADLKSGQTVVHGLSGAAELVTRGDRVAVKLDLASRDFAAEGFGGVGLGGVGVRLSGTGDLPYPDLKSRPGFQNAQQDGRARLAFTVSGRSLGAGDAQARDVQGRIAFDGQTRGWIASFHLNGRTDASLQAASLTGPTLAASSPVLTVSQGVVDIVRDASGVRWTQRGPATLRTRASTLAGLSSADLAVVGRDITVGGKDAHWRARGPLSIGASRAAFDELVLRGVRGAVALDVQGGEGEGGESGTRLLATGALGSRAGSWPLFGPPAADDVPELAEMKRALGDFALAVPAFAIETDSAGVRVALAAPARLTPANGGVLTLAPASRPIFAARPGELGGGALNVTATRGRGLPQATVAVPDWRLTAGGFEARLDARASLDFGVARGLNLTTSGVLATDRGLLTYTANGCSAFTAVSLELGENDAFDVAGRFCPVGKPVVSVRDGRWHADGRVVDVAASAPFLGMTFDQAEGDVAVVGGPAGLGLRADVAAVRVRDAIAPRRFNPLFASGRAALSDEVWSGDFGVRDGRHDIGSVRLTHNGLTETGSVTIDAPGLVFVQGGLQPAMLTPLGADIVKSPVAGSVAFTGRFAWSPALSDGTSSGRLTIPGLDFVSPAGPVKGLSGTIDFTSLAPLVTAPGQSLRVASLETVTPLTDLDLTFGLGKASLAIGGGRIAAAGGLVSLEPFNVPLDIAKGGGAGAFDGVVVFDRVQLGDLIAGSGFQDRVSLDAVVSGRLPFHYDPKAGVRIEQGTLAAVQTGRLSIQREALSDIQAGGGGEVPPGMVEDLAYQAMQNLAFDALSADVNSLDQGRVSVLFHIKGRHDPPSRQELRLTVAELISRKFLDRTLPLPSNTGIDLTLDTTLNLDQLISDLMEVNRQRTGAAEPTVLPQAQP